MSERKPLSERELWNRMWKIPLAFALLVYGCFGVYNNDLFVGGRGGGFHLKGIGAIIAFIGFICGSIALIASSFKRSSNDKVKMLIDKLVNVAIALVLLGLVLYLLTLGKFI